MSATPDSTLANPEQRIADLERQLAEALAQQTATAEVLRVINSSPGELKPVFDAILEKALSLCEAAHGHLTVYQDGHFHCAAAQGDPRFVEWFRRRPPYGPGPGTTMEKIIQGASVVQVADATDDEAYRLGDPVRRAVAEIGGSRTAVSVALRKEDTLFGAVTVYRQEVRPFTDKQIALLQNFAAQAVIAMENARLLTETREALEQQTATAEVLGVINSSPGDLAPVFDAMLEKAMQLCEAAHGHVYIYDGDLLHPTAVRGEPRFTEWMWQTGAYRPAAGSVAERVVKGHVVHIPNAFEHEAYRTVPRFREVVEVSGCGSLLTVPLRKGDTVLGTINVYRREIRPFTDKQIALLQNFAAQAVIAIENARLIAETREALEQQTATAEVLQVINSSPGDLAPVFDTILEKTHSLCGATKGSFVTVDGEHFRAVAMRGLSEPYARILREAQHNPAGSAPDRLLNGESLVHLPDASESEFPIPRAAAELEGARTILYVPLRKDSALLGYVTAYRQEIRPFTDKQIALMQNFAAQAVIAMENARLITETREALEQQTATAEVLQVINSSPGDLAPVFDALLERATRQCGAAYGHLMTYADGCFTTVADLGGALAKGLSVRPQEGYALHRLMQGEPLVHVTKVFEDPAYHASQPYRDWVEQGGVRTFLLVALRKDDALLGMLGVYSREEKPFSDKQIALLENFAAQAVIAMENARLLTETREALEQQTATAEVLQVINSSPGDLKPVFDAILEKATQLCDAPFGVLRTWDGERFHHIAAQGDPQFTERIWKYGPWAPANESSPAGRIVGGEQVVRFADAPDHEAVSISPGFRELVEASGMRSGVTVALRKDDTLRGTVTVFRREVRPFTDKQIALLQNFAAQAVIAMENARLLTETREALEQQTATAEVLQVINSSPGNLAPVFDAMLEKAMRLCEAAHGHLLTYDGESLHPAAMRGDPRYVEWVRQLGPIRPPPNVPLGRMINGERIVHVADIRNNTVSREHAEIGGIRSVLGVALRKDDALLGTLSVYRQEVRPFSDKQIALLQNFAAQAVIAMENARLITETREALEQQTATAEVLQVINSSPGDLAPVFDAILEKAHSLCGAPLGSLVLHDGEQLRAVATRGYPEEYEALARAGFAPTEVFNRLLSGERFIQDADSWESGPDDEHPMKHAAREIAGVRTLLAVPLHKEGALLGYISAQRQVVSPFNEKQIALLQNFAAQAVIAMENARLITETREALEQQTATAEVLQVINSSPGDLAPVFDAMLDRAVQLCAAAHGSLRIFDGEAFHLAATDVGERFAVRAHRLGPIVPYSGHPIGSSARFSLMRARRNSREPRNALSIP